MSDIDRRVNKIQTKLDYLGGISLFSATMYQGAKLGKIPGQNAQIARLENSKHEAKRLDASQAAGNKSEVVEYRMTFKRAGKDVDTTEYRPVSIVQLKSEQIQLQKALKTEAPNYDFGAGGLGIAIGFLASTLVVTKLGDFISENICEPVAEGLAIIETKTINGFKHASNWLTQKLPKKSDNESQKPTVE